MAADRMNERVSYLYLSYNPAILRLVKMVIDAAHKEGKWAGMCGEMAGDEVERLIRNTFEQKPHHRKLPINTP
jgi:phosphoenolpyruvate-protein kinase (PTS system EI component)